MSEVDWSEAPEGAGFYALGNFYFEDGENNLRVWGSNGREWVRSILFLEDIKSSPSYEERPKEEKPSAVMIGSEFGLALVESLGLDPSKVSSDIKLNVGSDEMFSVDLRVNLTVDEVRKACDICSDGVKV